MVVVREKGYAYREDLGWRVSLGIADTVILGKRAVRRIAAVLYRHEHHCMLPVFPVPNSHVL
jgi:hypothetical protein